MIRRPTSRGPDSPVTRSPIPAEYERLHALYEISSALARSTGVTHACAAALAIVRRVVPITAAVLLDATEEMPVTWTWAAEDAAPGALELAQDRARTALAYLAPRREGTLDVLGDGPRDRYVITLPLVTSEVCGVFQIERSEPFEERDLLFIDAVVDQLAITCDRHHARMLLEAARASTEEANRRLGQLEQITTVALEGATLDDRLHAILRALADVFAAHAAAVLLASADGETLVKRASIGLVDPDVPPVPIDAGIAGQLATARAAIVVNDLGERAGLGPILRASDVRSLVGSPLRDQRTNHGIMFVGARERGRFTPDDERLMDRVAARIEKIIAREVRYDTALAAIRSRDAILGTVSHDLRAPLSRIDAWAEVLRADASYTVDGLDIIQESVAQMARMVGDLLDTTSIEAGHLSVRISAESASALVSDAVENIRAAAALKQVRLETRLPARDLLVECDRLRILQVLTNLLSNAVKFTPARGTIRAVLVEEDGRARFSVQDTGSGISEDDLAHVFDRHWQATRTLQRGSGLGLSIAKGIVESHGGTLMVESQIGRGTTFSFALPLVRRDD